MISLPYRWISTIFLVLFVIACDKQTIYDRVIPLSADGWSYDEKVDFLYTISDTLKTYDILIHVRNTKSYAYSNLWLFIETLAPNDRIQRDTLEIILADETGRWMGKRKQSINTVLIPYREIVHFSGRGIYQTTIQHAMRDTTLKHITDVGLRIQFHSPK